MGPFLAVAAVAALATLVSTPMVGRLALRIGAVDRPGDPRKVHRRTVPTLGGLAMLIGFLAATAAAWALASAGLDTASGGEAAFAPAFAATTEPLGLLFAALFITLVGFVDDTRGLSPPVKLGGQVLAALIVVLSGIQLVYAWIPGVGVLVLSPDLGVPLTVLVIVAMINAVNFIDGLDGLAAGVVGIAALAFFGFTFASEARALVDSAPTSADLVAAALIGMCLGFLWHNFHPARIFMGDTGSMLLGLLLGSSGVACVGRSTDPSYADFVGTVPLFIPALVMAVPIVDTTWAVVRRLYRGQPISEPDRGHLHHRLLHTGVSHRQAVLTLYYWSGVVAFGAVGAAFLSPQSLLVVMVALLVGGVVVTAAGLHRARSGRQSNGEDVPQRHSV